MNNHINSYKNISDNSKKYSNDFLSSNRNSFILVMDNCSNYSSLSNNLAIIFIIYGRQQNNKTTNTVFSL